MHGVAFAVAEHLNFDVARLLQILFHIDGVVFEGRFGLRPCSRERESEVGLGVGDFHAASAAAGSGLDQHGEAHSLSHFESLGFAGHCAIRARHDWNAKFLRGHLGFDLVAHGPDVLGCRADKRDLVLFEYFGEAGIFRQEAVARVNGVGACDLAGGDEGRDIEIAFAGSRRADAHTFVRETHMHGVGICGRMNGNGCDAEFLAGPLDAQSNFTPVCNQDLVEHVGGFLERLVAFI